MAKQNMKQKKKYKNKIKYILKSQNKKEKTLQHKNIILNQIQMGEGAQ